MKRSKQQKNYEPQKRGERGSENEEIGREMVGEEKKKLTVEGQGV
jgi:hypothetical protein